MWDLSIFTLLRRARIVRLTEYFELHLGCWTCRLFDRSRSPRATSPACPDRTDGSSLQAIRMRRDRWDEMIWLLHLRGSATLWPGFEQSWILKPDVSRLAGTNHKLGLSTWVSLTFTGPRRWLKLAKVHIMQVVVFTCPYFARGPCHRLAMAS